VVFFLWHNVICCVSRSQSFSAANKKAVLSQETTARCYYYCDRRTDGRTEMP